MGIFDWQLTVIGQKGSPVKCPYGPTVATGTRLCGGNFSSGGVWKDPDVSSCKFKSERTNKLNALAKVCKTFLKTLFFLNTGKKRSTVLSLELKNSKVHLQSPSFVLELKTVSKG